MQRLGALGVQALLLSLCGAAHAAAPAAVPFDPASTAAAPCGTGTPPPGHEPPEVRPGRDGLVLTVRQDKDWLCYEANGDAEAPVIRVRRGDDLTITLRNEITDAQAIDDVTASGTLKVPNRAVPDSADYLPVVPGMRHHATGATNLHVHGFAVPPVAPADDVLTVCVDPAVGPAECGRREFTYHYQVPDDMPEGLYWYHPHVHGQVQGQMLMGLTGAIVVEGPDDDARRAAGITEHVLVIRQTQDLDAGKAPAASMTNAPDDAATPPRRPARTVASSAIDTDHELLCANNAGTDELSLNGTPIRVGQVADTSLTRYEFQPAERQFWRILNAATDAFLDLAIVTDDGKALPVQVVALDGTPLTDDSGRRLPAAWTDEAQLVPPAGRIEMLVSAPPPGRKAYLVTHAVDTGCAGDRLPERTLAVIETRAGEAPVAAALPHLSERDPSLYSRLLARKTDRVRTIAMAEYPRPGASDETDFYIVERKPGAVLSPYMMDGKPAITVKAGTTEEWIVENWTNELHAFHIHQVHFRVLEVDGKRVAKPPLLDVVEVPYATATGFHSKEGPVRPGRVRVKLTFPAALAGDIPFHCHLADHEDNGMMAIIRVLPEGAAPPAPGPEAGSMAHSMSSGS